MVFSGYMRCLIHLGRAGPSSILLMDFAIFEIDIRKRLLAQAH
jgi:hypothetical protein